MIRGWKPIFAVLLAAMVLNAVLAQLLEKYRDPRRLAAGEFAGSVMLAAMRPVVKSYLWSRADTLIRQRKYFEVKPILDRLAEIEPHFTEAYFFNAAVLAFDMPVFAKRTEVKWRWVSEGFRYAVRGAEVNPDEPSLPWLAAWILYQKIVRNKWHGKEFYRLFMEDTASNPGLVPPLPVIIRYAEQSRALPGHDASTEILLDRIYRAQVDQAKKRDDLEIAIAFTERRRILWEEFVPPADRSRMKWKEKKASALSEIVRELEALLGQREAPR